MLKSLYAAVIATGVAAIGEPPADRPPAIERSHLINLATPVAPDIAGRVAARDPHAIRMDVPGQVTPAVMAAITAWLTDKFDLPAGAHPAIDFAAPARLAIMRNGGLVARRDQGAGADQQSGEGTVLALYHDAKRTIFLSEGWTGTTPAEMSILVHEMVHHLQNLAGLKYNCAGAREKLAYDAQAAWLAHFDKTLESEFGIDGFSLITHSNCMI